jgi:hypothetical protein
MLCTHIHRQSGKLIFNNDRWHCLPTAKPASCHKTRTPDEEDIIEGEEDLA